MPNLFANVGAERRQDQIESLIHLLASTGKLADTAPSTNAVKQGKALFRSIGCLACHDQRQDHTTPLSTSVPLGTVADKYSIPGLTAFLQDPLRVRPTGRMPNLSLSPDEARHIASYLLKDVRVEPLLQYTYYEGSWQKLPDFSKLKPKATGKAAHFDVDVGRENQFAIRFSGLLQLSQAGEYTFHLGSDDGSRLLINQREVVKVDGIHPVQFRQATHRLESGIHDLVIEFFEQGGGQELRLEMEGPDIKRQPVTLFLTSSKNVETDNQRLTIDPDRIVAGRRLFASLGCASCHQLQRISPTPHLDSVPRLSMVATTVGCLGPTAQRGIPFYGLDDRQRHALAVATKRLQAADRPLHSAAEKIDQTLAHFKLFCLSSAGSEGRRGTGPRWLFPFPPEGDGGRRASAASINRHRCQAPSRLAAQGVRSGLPRTSVYDDQNAPIRNPQCGIAHPCLGIGRHRVGRQARSRENPSPSPQSRGSSAHRKSGVFLRQMSHICTTSGNRNSGPQSDLDDTPPERELVSPLHAESADLSSRHTNARFLAQRASITASSARWRRRRTSACSLDLPGGRRPCGVAAWASRADSRVGSDR